MELNVLELDEGYKKGELLSSGKTKDIYSVEGEPTFVIMKNNDNVSCGDGARIEEGKGKADYSTTITSNVFEYLNKKGIRTHFLQRVSSDEILVEKCDMIPVECVFRFVATGSYIKREKHIRGNDAIIDGTILPIPIIELYYKNDVLTVEGESISDPMIKIGEDSLPELDDTGKLYLLDPKTGMEISYTAVFEGSTEKQVTFTNIKKDSENIRNQAKQLFEKTYEVGKSIKSFYEEVGINTFDGKVEFGVSPDNKIILADVIDGDSCRLRVPYTVEGSDGKIYLAGDFMPGELNGMGGKSLAFFENLEELPEGIRIKRIVGAEGLDKDGFREGEDDVDETVRKYAVLSEKSGEALSKSKIDNPISTDTIEKVIAALEKA